MLTNYHSHSKWCKHGTGEVEDYIKEAIKCGLKEYAISEHVPYPFNAGLRIELKQMDEFINELDFLIDKYKNDIKILKGLECEYFEDFNDHYIDLKEKYNIDFLVLGQHFYDSSFGIDFFQINSDENIKKYEEAVVKGINSGLFDIVAHPDVFLCSTTFNEQALKSTKNILKECEQNNIAVEINANGVRLNRGYPSKKFWEQSKNYNLTYLINSDCHEVRFLLDDAVNKTYDFASDLDIKITEFLEFKQ